jgi:hypothetical protein
MSPNNPYPQQPPGQPQWGYSPQGYPTPQPWQPQPSTQPPTPPKSRTPLIIAIVSAAVIVAIGIADILILNRNHSRNPASTNPLTGQGNNIPAGWRQVNVPFDIYDVVHTDFKVAPSDGSTAYACVTTDKDSAKVVWRTNDSGKTWKKVSTLPDAQSGSSDCFLTLDSGDPRSLLASISALDSVYSRDGGATWTAVPNDLIISDPATYHGTTYAIVHGLDPANPTSLLNGVASSRDGWKTWIPVGDSQRGDLSLLWVNPNNGSMLAKSDSYHYLESGDLGKTWHDNGVAPPPDTEENDVNVFVTPAAAGNTWFICATPMSLSNFTATECSYDSGKSWKTLPTLNDPKDDDGAMLDAQGNVIVISIHLPSLDGTPPSNDTPASSSADGYYRFARNGTRWQKLTLPDDSANFYYAANPAPGIVWDIGLRTTTVASASVFK